MFITLVDVLKGMTIVLEYSIYFFYNLLYNVAIVDGNSELRLIIKKYKISIVDIQLLS